MVTTAIVVSVILTLILLIFARVGLSFIFLLVKELNKFEKMEGKKVTGKQLRDMKMTINLEIKED